MQERAAVIPKTIKTLRSLLCQRAHYTGRGILIRNELKVVVVGDGYHPPNWCHERVS